MLQPKKVKYTSQFRGRLKGKANRGGSLEFGDYGLKNLSPGFLSAAQIEAARKAIRHHLRRGGKLWIRIFPSKPVTKKPPEVRMGSGKAPFDHYVAVVRPGLILFELAGVEKNAAFEALRLAAHKLPTQTKFVAKEE